VQRGHFVFRLVFPCRIRGVFRNGVIRMKRMITRA